MWEGSYCWQREAEPCNWLPKGSEGGPNRFYLPRPDAPGGEPVVLKPSSQGERQVCEGQGPLVPWLELPQGTPSGVQPQTRDLPMLAHARPCLPPPLIFCAVNKWHYCSQQPWNVGAEAQTHGTRCSGFMSIMITFSLSFPTSKLGLYELNPRGTFQNVPCQAMYLRLWWEASARCPMSDQYYFLSL